jgi:type II secretory pathway predicted ATPase ExeA
MYAKYFGFREKPFNVTPDPRFFYVNTIYQEAYASLLYGIRERKGFIVLTGEVGTGKTTVLRRLMANLEESIHFVFFYNTTLTFQELLTFICEDLGLQVEGRGSLQKIQALNGFLLSRLQEGGTGVLLIDEAQNLGDDVLENLRLLSNLETSSEKLLQIVLVGHPELETKLAQPKLRQLKQRVAIQARLDRLKDREIGPFIYHRLRMVGYESSDLFPQETIQRISMYSRGTPRLINIICDNALLIAYSTNQKIISVDIIEEVARDLQLRTESRSARREIVGTSKGEPKLLPPSEGKVQVMKVEVSSPVSGLQERNTPSFAPEGASVQHRSRRSLGLRKAGIALALVFAGAVGVAVTSKPLTRFFGLDFLNGDSWVRVARGYWSSFLVGNDSSEKAPSQDARTTEEVPSLLEPSIKEPTVSQPSSLPGVVSEQRGADSNSLSAMAAGVEKEAEHAIKEEAGPLPGLQTASRPQSNWRESPLVIQYGTTAFDIVFQHYGSYNTLAVDLIKEFNPHIGNLDRILAGEKIWLPPLTRETLLREQPDGFYHLIVTSVRGLQEAERFAQTVRQKGYLVEVVPKRVSGSVLLYRVEIKKLRDLAAVEQAWEFVNKG